MTYEIRAHPKLAEQVAKLNKAGAQARVRKLLIRAKEVLAEDPTHEGYVLTDDLRSVQRVKSGRLRLFFAYSTPLERVVLLYLGLRKDGDPSDPYVVMSQLLGKGCFDGVFAELGLSRD